MNNGKSPGVDNISAELLNADVKLSYNKIKELFSNIWNNEQIPTNWKKGLIIKLLKKKIFKKMQKLERRHFITRNEQDSWKDTDR